MSPCGPAISTSDQAPPVSSPPKRLERLGYLRSEKRPGKTRPRTHYQLTERREQALAGWLAQPAAFPARPARSRRPCPRRRPRRRRDVHSLGRKLLRFHDEWADEVERELSRRS
jgi:DNA-binding PadR family transcriptional regulator